MKRLLDLIPAGGDAMAKEVERLFRRNADDHTPWRDAEEFLETLDRALNGSEAEKAEARAWIAAREPNKFNPISEQQVLDLNLKARTYLLCACHWFVHDGNVSGERWHPYVRWADQLTDLDTIASFNYDLVIERAAGTRISPLTPKQPSLDQEGRARTKQPLFLKLHGSVNWRLGDKTFFHEIAEPIELLKQGYRPAIGIPGPFKLKLTTGELQPSFEIVENALKEATRVVFLGYRFPPTDNEAKRRLLTAIGANQRPEFEITVVLGPDVGHEDVMRLRGLLKWARPRDSESRIHVEPLWVQDFLGVVRVPFFT